MTLHTTKGKTCIEGALVEVQENGKLFYEISICGDWCAKYIPKYECCIDILYKLSEIEKPQKDSM